METTDYIESYKIFKRFYDSLSILLFSLKKRLQGREDTDKVPNYYFMFLASFDDDVNYLLNYFKTCLDSKDTFANKTVLESIKKFFININKMKVGIADDWKKIEKWIGDKNTKMGPNRRTDLESLIKRCDDILNIVPWISFLDIWGKCFDCMTQRIEENSRKNQGTSSKTTKKQDTTTTSTAKIKEIVAKSNTLYETTYSRLLEELVSLDHDGERNITQWLIQILMHSFRDTRELLKKTKSQLISDLKSRLQKFPLSDKHNAIPKTLESEVISMLQKNPHQSIKDDMKEALFLQYQQLALSTSSRGTLSIYIEECIDITWLMNTCTPPMVISADDEVFDLAKHIRISGYGEKIKYFLWPCIYSSEEQRKKDVVLQRAYVVKGDDEGANMQYQQQAKKRPLPIMKDEYPDVKDSKNIKIIIN